MNITDLLQSQLSGAVLSQLTQKIGAGDQQKTAAATSGIMNILLGAMAQNAAKPGGADALSKALDRDHDGSIMGNLMEMLSGQMQPSNPKTVNGEGILGHILGKRQPAAVEAVSKSSGLNANQVATLMSTLAPIIMGALGQAKKQNNLDADGLSGMLGGLLSGMTAGGSSKKQVDPKMAIINAFLDKNKDGSIADDLMRMGGSFLGKLFGGKK